MSIEDWTKRAMNDMYEGAKTQKLHQWAKAMACALAMEDTNKSGDVAKLMETLEPGSSKKALEWVNSGAEEDELEYYL